MCQKYVKHKNLIFERYFNSSICKIKLVSKINFSEYNFNKLIKRELLGSSNKINKQTGVTVNVLQKKILIEFQINIKM